MTRRPILIYGTRHRLRAVLSTSNEEAATPMKAAALGVSNISECAGKTRSATVDGRVFLMWK